MQLKTFSATVKTSTRKLLILLVLAMPSLGHTQVSGGQISSEPSANVTSSQMVAVEQVVPVVAAPEPVYCVFKDLQLGETCPAYSAARGIEIQGVGGETILFIEKDLIGKGTKPERTSIVASSRIEDAVLLEEFDSDDALLLEQEVRGLSGARYELPSSRSEIKRMVGFPENAEVAKEDWIEMLRVHAEMALSLSANASQFILDQLGLVSDSVTTANAAVEKNSGTMSGLALGLVSDSSSEVTSRSSTPLATPAQSAPPIAQSR